MEHIEISSDSQASRSTTNHHRSTRTPEQLNAYNRSFIFDIHETVSDDRSRGRKVFEAQTHRSRRTRRTETQRTKTENSGTKRATTSQEQEPTIAVLNKPPLLGNKNRRWQNCRNFHLPESKPAATELWKPPPPRIEETKERTCKLKKRKAKRKKNRTDRGCGSPLHRPATLFTVEI